MRLLSPTSSVAVAVALLVLLSQFTANAQYGPGEVCTGTFDGLAAGSDAMRLIALRNRYSKCKKVDGNLELTFAISNADTSKIKSNDSLVDFLNNIVEVTGYVLVSGTFYTKLPLRSLRLIRGDRLYRPSVTNNLACSLCIIANPMLSSFGFESLTEIRSGSVFVLGRQSPKLAYVNTVNWADLFNPQAASESGSVQELVANDVTAPKGACNPSCTTGSCFGPSLAECHYLTRLTCTHCASRCMRPNVPQGGSCCASTCVGGCFNLTEEGCVSCENYRDNGRCVSQCPPKIIVNPRTNQPVPNPNYKVSFAGECLKSCPAHVVEEHGMCLAACLPGNRERDNGTCEPCPAGEPCPVYCDGNDIPPKIVTVGVRDYMDGDEIKKFANCTHVKGNIAITYRSFTSATPTPIDPADLQLLKSVQVVGGYVLIQMEKPHDFFTDYSFFGNLRTVHGRYLMNDYAMQLIDTASLTQMAMNNLKRVSYGNVFVAGTPCNARNVNWTAITPPASIVAIQPRPGTTQCSPAYACASECASGCWGPSDSQCQACRNLKLGDRCVSQCPSSLFFVNNSACLPCDAECAEGCSGQGPDSCLGACRNFREGNRCVNKCSANFWSAANGSCLSCSSLCERGCTGPGTYIGQGGCNDCFRTIIANDPAAPKQCGSRVTQCEVGYATQSKGADASVSGVLCMQCPAGCYSCTSSTKCSVCEAARVVHLPYDTNLLPKLTAAGYSTDVSDVFPDAYADLSYQQTFFSALPLLEKSSCLPPDSQATPNSAFSCPSTPLTFLYRPKMNTSCVSQTLLAIDGIPEIRDPTVDGGVTPQSLDRAALRPCRFGDNLCMQCNILCVGGCAGPLASNCSDCSYARVLFDEADATRGFECVSKCPPEKPWRVNDSICSANMPADERRKITIIVVSVTVVAVTTVVAIVVTITMLRKRARDQMRTRKIEAEMAGIELQEPLMETDAKPDMSKLTLIKETELRLGGTIGSGAFGTVYKGLWLPEGQKVRIPVAVKVLTEKSTKANAEFMDEVRVMAAVQHPFCIRIAGICMGEQLQLVTPLMQHGSLLDYLRKNQDSLGSRQLLTWATQIALGMHYLEQRAVVHRDLAARNVLVAGHDQVRITDFGLAKLLDVNEAEYRATGGKLPIKWLAIECIRHRSFTHKSDVWAYGVTLWEMFTFGSRPYEDTPARQMVELLEKGDRLQQPESCTIDLYMWMIKCWYPDPASRPSFDQLAEQFAKMSRDPGRFLSIRGDKNAHKTAAPGRSEQDREEALRKLLGEFDDDADDSLRVMDVDDYLAPVSGGRNGISSYDHSSSSQSNGRADSSLPPLYVATFDLPAPPGLAPPPVPVYDYSLAGAPSNSAVAAASSPNYGALEAQKLRKARKGSGNSQPDSPHDRYADDPFKLVQEIEAEENKRMQVRGDTQPRAAAPQRESDNVDSDGYLEPRSMTSTDYSLAGPTASQQDDGYSLAASNNTG